MKFGSLPKDINQEQVTDALKTHAQSGEEFLFACKVTVGFKTEVFGISNIGLIVLSSKDLGSSFVTELIPVSNNLYEGELYLVTDKGSVRLLPLVQMGAAPKEALSTCYFYSRLEDNGAELVTYQFSGQDKMTDNSSALLKTISDIISLEDSPIESL